MANLRQKLANPNLFPRELDGQEHKIVHALIRDPRASDNQIGKMTGVPIRTVSRKRRKIEEEGLLNYYVNLDRTRTGRFGAKHLYLIKFKLGITRGQLIKEIMEEPNIKTVFTELIHESHIAEVDGHVALAMIVEGHNDGEIVDSFNAKIIPSLEKNHGKGCIEEIKTIRLAEPIRIFHNYVPLVNMRYGKIKKEWHDSAIFVC